jgi:hypothetical protein
VTISTVPLKNNTGSVLGSVSGIRAFVNDATTGELVLLKTGLSTNAAGILSFSDPALVVGAIDSVRIHVDGTGAEGLDTITAT